MKTLYSVTARATGGREGVVESEDPTFRLELSVPRGVGGKGGSGSNPEQLFACGYSACFASAVQHFAEQKHVVTGEFSISAQVALQTREGGAYGLDVELIGDFPELPVGQAEGLMKAAHQICPYSQAIKGNVEVRLSVKDD